MRRTHIQALKKKILVLDINFSTREFRVHQPVENVSEASHPEEGSKRPEEIPASRHAFQA